MDLNILVIRAGVEEQEKLLRAPELEEAAISFVRADDEAIGFAREAASVTAVLVRDPSPRLARRLREIASTRHSLFLLLSPLAERPDYPVAWDEVLDHWLVTPLVPEELSERVAGIVGSRGLKLTALAAELGVERGSVCEALGTCGFQTVFEAEDIASASELLEKRAGNIALVLARWRPGETTALDLLARLKSVSHWSRIPSFLLAPATALITAQGEELTRREFGERLELIPSALEYFSDRLNRRYGVLSFLREASVFLSRGQTPYAVTLLQHAIRLFPDCALLHAALGNASAVSFDELNYLENAAVILHDAVQLDPTERSTIMACAEILVRLDRPADAAKVLQLGVATRPLDGELRSSLAEAYKRAGDSGAALVETRRAILLSLTP